MALAPWDLVSWQSLSETASLCEPLNAGVRRESYLRATRTPTGGLERQDSLFRRVGSIGSVAMMAATNNNSNSNTNGNGNLKNNAEGIRKNASYSEIFQTPAGDVSVVITDHSSSSPVANGTAGHAIDPKNPKSAQQNSTNQNSVSNPTKGDHSDDELCTGKKKTKVKEKPGQSPGSAKQETMSKLSSDPGSSLAPNPAYRSRDIFVLCIVFIFAFSAVRAVQVLQSSVNDKAKLGTMALSLFYLTLAVTVVLVPPLCQHRMSDRTALCVGIFLLFMWLSANLVPHPAILLPAAILGGLGLTLAWTAQRSAFAAFFSGASQEIQNEVSNGQDRKLSLRRFLLTNNTLFALFQSSHIWGNLSVATILLAETRSSQTLVPNNSTQVVKVIAQSNRSLEYNLTIGPGWYVLPPLFRVDIMPMLSSQYDDLWAHCRKDVDFLPSLDDWSEIGNFTKFELVSFPAAWALAWLVALGFIALILAAIFFHPNSQPDPEEDDDEDIDLSARVQKFAVAHMFQMFDGPNFRLLIPLLFFNGLEQGFLYTDYTKIYLSCMFGLSSVGVAVMVSGVMSCFFSAAASFAAKRSVSREILISVAAIVHLGLAAFLYQWQAYPSIPILVIVIPVIYGFCDAVWQTHCYVLITKVAGNDHQLAFSNFRILQSLGIATSCLLSYFSGIGLKVTILVSNLLLSVLCYAILENRIRREELAAIDRERLAGVFKQLTMVIGAAGIRDRNLRTQPVKRQVSSPADYISPPKISSPSKMKPVTFDLGNHHQPAHQPQAYIVNDTNEEIL